MFQCVIRTRRISGTFQSWEYKAVAILYDDSDGWNDNQMPPIVNQSTRPADAFSKLHAAGTWCFAYTVKRDTHVRYPLVPIYVL